MEFVNILSMLRHKGIKVLNTCLTNKNTMNYNKLTLEYNLLKNTFLTCKMHIAFKKKYFWLFSKRWPVN